MALSPFDADGRVPLFGFAGRRAGGRILAISPDGVGAEDGGVPCDGLDGLLKAYRTHVPALAPGATRSLVHVVRKAISVMADADAAGAEREMLIALVLTAGDSAGYVALSAALVDASRLPICFVVIGVGAGPFKDLERFDDELGQRAYRGRRPSFAPSPLTSFLLRSLP